MTPGVQAASHPGRARGGSGRRRGASPGQAFPCPVSEPARPHLRLVFPPCSRLLLGPIFLAVFVEPSFTVDRFFLLSVTVPWSQQAHHSHHQDRVWKSLPAPQDFLAAPRSRLLPILHAFRSSACAPAACSGSFSGIGGLVFRGHSFLPLLASRGGGPSWGSPGVGPPAPVATHFLPVRLRPCC